jgi:gas vesicle protein
MANHSHEQAENNLHQDEAAEPKGFGVGLLVGAIIAGLVGAGAMLLLAPQSGEQTRAKLQQQGLKLRYWAVGDKTHQLTDDVDKQAEELAQRSQAMLDEGSPAL